MVTINRQDETLAERDEVLFPNTHMIDTEPIYKNFTTIENFLHYNHSDKTSIHSNNNGSSSLYYLTNKNSCDGYIFNLIDIVEEIGYNPQTPFIHSSRTNHDNNNKELFNIILNLGGAYGPLVSIRRSYFNREYFQRWYLEKYSCYASLNRSNHLIKKPMEKFDDDNQLNIHLHSSINKFQQMDEKQFQNHVLQMYGFDDLETISSSISSGRSSINEIDSQELTSTDHFKPKQQITIREYYPSNDMPSLIVNRSMLSSQETIEDNDYEQLIANHPELYNDPNPKIITKQNPDQITYKQNVSVRYLIPPTPPPPGPLIIREILPPKPPSPPPLIIKHQDPEIPTPPPLILREAPPTPPPHQEAKIITKILPQEPPSSQRVIIEHNPSLPPKPQSIIIEKWLPYKSPPPREIIYERVIETPVISQFQPADKIIDRQHRRSTNFYSKSSSHLPIPIPVHIERQNSIDHFDTRQSSVFDQFARFTQQQLETLQTHHQWINNQHQQHMNMVQQLTTPTLIVHHPPVTRTFTSYAQRNQVLYQPILMYPIYT